MKRPLAVRVGIALFLLALILRAGALFVAIPHANGTLTGVGGEVASLLIYSAFIYAMAQGSNLARLIFAFLFVTGAALIMLFALGTHRPTELSGSRLAVFLLVGAGVVSLFVPSAAAWYHCSDRSSLTRA